MQAFNPSAPRASFGFLHANSSELPAFNSITPEEVASFNNTLNLYSNIRPYRDLIKMLDSCFTSEGQRRDLTISNIIISVATRQLILLFKTENRNQITVEECGAAILSNALNSIALKYPENFEQQYQQGEIEKIVSAAFHQF